MIFVLNGEGPTDLGICNNGQGLCQDADYTRGPMTVLVDQIAESVLHYSLLDVPGSYRYVSRKYISEWSKSNQPRLRPTRGKYSPSEVGIYRTNAFALGEIAKNISASEDRPAIAVLFRDADGTNSSELSLWSDKCRAIEDGYRLADYSQQGVVMLPMPKSEAWLICNARNHQQCHTYESLPGNDAAPRSAKAILREIRGQDDTAETLAEWLINHPERQHEKCTMPSYVHFRESLIRAVKSIGKN